VSGRTFRSLVIVGGLGFSGVALWLPGPLRRWFLARVDELTEDIVGAAASTWSDPGEVDTAA
jgi:hypothetical protein